MKKLLRPLFLALTFTIFSSRFAYPQLVLAVSVEPSAPFSVEGNPNEDYMFDEIFPLFRYIPAPHFEIYENQDRSRAYEPTIVCPGTNADRRDYYCDNAKTKESGCDGGEVDKCDKFSNQFDHTTTSSGVGCKLPKPDPNYPDAFLVGKCEYKQKPSITRNVKGTDFAENDTLVFSKIQSESLAYTNIGTDNAITWGSQHLSSSFDQKVINQLMVLSRAKQTKHTLALTGEWPLGWVDWGYKTPNGKTLLEIQEGLPGNVSAAGMMIIESDDDFYLTGGNIEIITDVSIQRADVVKTIRLATQQNPQPQWVKDFLQSPIYAPSFRRGYIRPSICVRDRCCPGENCPLSSDLLTGQKRGLYYDISVSQAYGAAMDDLFKTNSLSEGMELFKKLLVTNPLTRYLTSADPAATPSRITKELDELLKGTCYDYAPFSTWNSFGLYIDYAKPGDFLDPGKNCIGHEIMPVAVKETAAATTPSLIDIIVSLIWGQKEDDVDTTTKHLITVPDAMGQSIDDLQAPVYDTRDILAELESVKEYNEKMSNIVDDEADHLYSGKRTGPNRAKRFTSLYSCADDMYAAQTLVNIEAYATGARPGCHGQAPTTGKCDPTLFANLLAKSNGIPTTASTRADEYFTTYIKPNLTEEMMGTYGAASEATGIPCEVFIGIHYVESGNAPDTSLVSGRKIGVPEPDQGGRIFTSVLETAIFSGDHLKGKVGGTIDDIPTLITAFSRRNGGGNSNCQLGYPYPIPYNSCPRKFEGEDDAYPVNWLDERHAKMYLLYCADNTACQPQEWLRPGAYTVALSAYNLMTKDGFVPSDLPTTPQASTPPPIVTNTSKTSATGFFPRSCGPESLSTALGCIPYTRDAFASALLTFIVGIASAITSVVMLIATIQIMTAGGNSEQLKKGKELFTSAVLGLLFLILSVSLLKIIAGDIIKLPGF